jgi:hypothetical protein
MNLDGPIAACAATAGLGLRREAKRHAALAPRSRVLLLIATVATLWFAPALAADSASAPTTPAARLETARAEIALTRSNIVLTLEQLDNVRRSEDPHAQFQRFVEQLARMKERAKLTQERAQLMKSKGDAYFAEWEARTGASADPAARRQAEAAQAKRKTSYDLIVRQMQMARTNFTPLLAELEQIKTLLEGERSQEKIAAAKDLFTQANWHCVSVQRALMRTEDELGILATNLAGTAQGTPAGHN